MTTTIVRDQLELELFANLFDRPLDAPPPAAPAPVEVDTRAHVWIVAAEIKVEARIAKAADFRGSFTAAPGTRIDALEVYCRGCRRPFEDVSGQDCEALVDNRHLIGGDQSVRAKRKVPEPPPNAKLVPGGTIQRRGISAYLSGISRPAR
ncbi:hypothetical protein [Streptomyces fructofermentans]|uniref:Uncharacterized protein n=1 Tax=Streptomyces fructofermentans TaxID=152141 RepID=A0A918NP59_9ACTN|nr:hypothetical protein [Streptomyces fructofermentans]GGX84332.1 hypothetical protein GCM10010515_59890 [Streptomyces fructofermentans]